MCHFSPRHLCSGDRKLHHYTTATAASSFSTIETLVGDLSVSVVRGWEIEAEIYKLSYRCGSLLFSVNRVFAIDVIWGDCLFQFIMKLLFMQD